MEPHRPTLDYQRPEDPWPARQAFIVAAVIWSVASPVCAVLLLFAIGCSGAEGAIVVVLWLASCLAMLAGAVRLARSMADPWTRSAATAGTLCGFAIGALLVGGCFTYLAIGSY